MTDTAARTIDHLLPPDHLAAAIDAGHIARRQHPTLPLSILTYTRAAQYERAWTPITIACRGLIVENDTDRVIAKPFGKFFNVGEHTSGQPYAPPVPDEPFEVYDKVDGSLGIVFWYADTWRVASKGSFTSEQARWAQQWLDNHDTALLNPGITYLAEIIYPENRIVVDYGDRRDLVLLAAFDEDGREIRLRYAAADWHGVGSVVRSWPAPSLAELLERTASNVHLSGRTATGIDAEGYVIRFASGLRAKVKLAEYVRLHKLVTGVTERDVWRYLGMQRFAEQDPKQVAQALGCAVSEVEALATAGMGPLDALLEQVPDEFDTWVRGVAAGLEEQARQVSARIDTEYGQVAHLTSDRRAFARAAQDVKDRTVRAAMFLRLDGRPTDLAVWRSIKPAASDPFRTDDDA